MRVVVRLSYECQSVTSPLEPQITDVYLSSMGPWLESSS